MSTSFIILGSGQDGGSPQVGQRSSMSPQRTASCVAVIGPQGSVVLLDVTPDIRSQSNRLLTSERYPEGRDTFVDGVFITHAHMGHYGGLMHFGKEAVASDALPLFGTERLLGYLADNQPWATLLSERNLEPVAMDAMTAAIDGNLTVESIPVPHRDEFSDTVAFSVSLEGRPWLLYLPDIDGWDVWSAANDEITRHDIALLDATFSSTDELPGRDMQSIGHPTVPETIDRFAHLTADTHIILTHINHSNPLGNEASEITRQATGAGFSIAYDGLTIDSDRQMSIERIAGQFLVATPIIESPPFARSVVLMLDHDESGAIGLVLNSPTELLVSEHLPGLPGHISDPPNVFLGGPVSSDTAITLGHGHGVEFLRPSALPGIGIVDIDDQIDGLEALRVFAGYAGWDPTQLEAEIEEGAWWVLFPDLDEIFTSDVEGMWERTVERGPGTLPLYATYPKDPSTN